MKSPIQLTLSLSLLLMLALPAPAGAMAAREQNRHDREAAVSKDLTLDRAFTEIERKLIIEHYGHPDRDDLPSGLAEKERLPPGLEKHLHKNDRLPPGLEKRSLPVSLEKKLPKRTEDLVRRVIDDDIVLIDEAQGIILDIIHDIAR